MTKFYSKKLIRSGDIIEILEYEKSIAYDMQVPKNALGRSLVATGEDKTEIRGQTLRKAQKDVRRLINANIGITDKPKFLTLTFAKNIQDIKSANYEFKKFKQRLQYANGDIKLKYLVVMEFQKRGAIHYHAIFFNLPYVPSKTIADIWGHGFVKLNKIDSVDNIGAYVTKYMTKQDYEKEKSDKLIGKKSYFTSRNLIKPYESIDENEINQVATELSQHLAYFSNFATDQFGNINYFQYNLKRKKIVQT